jgi:predicted dehydrogenase
MPAKRPSFPAPRLNCYRYQERGLMSYTRRDFHRIAGLAAASQIMGSAQTPAQGRKLRYCIVGLGRISMDHFMPATRASQYGQVTAIVSGHRDKADKMAAQYNIPAKNIYSYQNFDDIAGNKDIDAVYIALPNSMHAEYTIRAAKAGKHVLCEKPMATSVADSEAMIDACRKAKSRLMIAYRCHFEPVNLKAVELIRQGKLGKIVGINSAFGFNIAPNEWRLNKALAGGGPMMDVGIYCLNACRYLTGEEPSEVKGYSYSDPKDARFKEVEEALSWSMKFPSGAVASCSTTYGANMTPFVRVYGTRGTLEINDAFGYNGQHLTAQGVDMPSTQKDPYVFQLEADHLAECVFGNKDPQCAGEEGLRDMKLMSAIYKTC